MATNNKETNGEHMHDHCCDMHHGHMGHYGMRWILGIVILLLVFWLGMKLGEFKSIVESNYGFGGYGNMMYRSGMGPGMMQYWQVPLNSSTGTTTAPAPSTSTKK